MKKNLLLLLTISLLTISGTSYSMQQAPTRMVDVSVKTEQPNITGLKRTRPTTITNEQEKEFDRLTKRQKQQQQQQQSFPKLYLEVSPKTLCGKKTTAVIFVKNHISNETIKTRIKKNIENIIDSIVGIYGIELYRRSIMNLNKIEILTPACIANLYISYKHIAQFIYDHVYQNLCGTKMIMIESINKHILVHLPINYHRRRQKVSSLLSKVYDEHISETFDLLESPLTQEPITEDEISFEKCLIDNLNYYIKHRSDWHKEN